MSGDLDGQDAFDRLLEVALESRVDVRHAQDERDHARAAQRDAEQQANEWRGKASDFERNERKQLPLLQELWEAAQALHDKVGPALIDDGDNLAIARLRAALEATNDCCGQPPF